MCPWINWDGKIAMTFNWNEGKTNTDYNKTHISFIYRPLIVVSVISHVQQLIMYITITYTLKRWLLKSCWIFFTSNVYTMVGTVFKIVKILKMTLLFKIWNTVYKGHCLYETLGFKQQ